MGCSSFISSLGHRLPEPLVWYDLSLQHVSWYLVVAGLVSAKLLSCPNNRVAFAWDIGRGVLCTWHFPVLLHLGAET